MTCDRWVHEGSQQIYLLSATTVSCVWLKLFLVVPRKTGTRHRRPRKFSTSKYACDVVKFALCPMRCSFCVCDGFAVRRDFSFCCALDCWVRVSLFAVRAKFSVFETASTGRLHACFALVLNLADSTTEESPRSGSWQTKCRCCH